MKFNKADIAKEALVFIGYAAGAGYVIVNYAALPDRIPIHFGLWGKPDGWAPKQLAFLLPVVATFLYMTLTIGQYYGKPNVPWRITPENRERIYALTNNLIWWLKLQTTWMIAYIQFVQVEVAHGRMEGLGGAFAFTFIGMIFFTLALYFYIGGRAAQGE